MNRFLVFLLVAIFGNVATFKAKTLTLGVGSTVFIIDFFLMLTAMDVKFAPWCNTAMTWSFVLGILGPLFQHIWYKIEKPKCKDCGRELHIASQEG